MSGQKVRRVLALLALAVLTAVADAGPVVRESEEWIVKTREHSTLTYLSENLGFPDTPVSKGTVVSITLGAATGEALIVGPIQFDAKKYAVALADAGIASGIEWSQEDDCAAVRTRWGQGRMWLRSAEQAFDVGRLLRELRNVDSNLWACVRVPRHALVEGSKKPSFSSKNYRYYDVSSAPDTMKLRVSASVPPLMPLWFVLFAGLVPVATASGILTGIWIAKRSSTPVEKRRRLYSKIVNYSAFGAIGVHAPIAIFLFSTGKLQPVCDIWFGSASVVSVFFPIMIVPAVLVPMLLPLSGRVEKKLFGPSPEEAQTLPKPEPISSEEKLHTRRVAAVSVALSVVGFFPWLWPGLFVSPKSEAFKLVQLAGGFVFFLSGPIAKLFFRRENRKYGGITENAQLTSEVHRIASEMSVRYRRVRVDASRVGKSVASASASSKGDVTLSQRALEVLDEDELRFILAHELAHLKLRHGRERVLRVFVPYLILTSPMFLMPFFIMQKGPQVPPGAILASIVAGMAYMFLVGRRLMKSQELEADRLALRMTGNLTGAEKALRKMALGTDMPHLHDMDEQVSHPALSKRVQALHEAATMA